MSKQIKNHVCKKNSYTIIVYLALLQYSTSFWVIGEIWIPTDLFLLGGGVVGDELVGIDSASLYDAGS